MRPLMCFVFGSMLFAQQPGRGVNFYSIEKEQALGSQLAAEYRRSATVVDSPELLARIEALGHALVPSDSKFTYTFAIVDDHGMLLNEPAAFPGGYIFAPSGLIEAARNIDELAGMLAHSIAHIEARHGTKLATKGQLANQASMPLIYMGGWTGYATRQNASLAVPLGYLKLARTFQLEADALGGQLMTAAGYNPARLADYIERLQPPDPATPDPRATQPPRAERAAALRALPAPTVAPKTAPDLAELEELLRQALPIKTKEPPRLAR
jgi:beta-barrel assembly-enhancing protease